MIHIIKICLILILEINLYHCLGHALRHLKWFPKDRAFGCSFVYGFIFYHFLFWCISFPCTIMNGSLSKVTFIWVITICVLSALAILAFWKSLLDSYRKLAAFLIRYRFWVIPCLLFIIFMIYYVCLNGQVDIDARTYIGEVTSMIDTDQLAGIDIQSGSPSDVILMRRAGSMFGLNSAVLCKVFHMHPLIFCRTVRAALNIVFLSVILLMFFQRVFNSDKKVIEKSIMLLMLSECTLFLFANSIYTSSAFILHRAYEGKAYCSTGLVVMAIYLAVSFCRTEDCRFFVLIFWGMIASMSISASAVFVIPVVVASILVAYCLVIRRWKYLCGLLLSVSPNIIYILLIVIGFGGFSVGGM